VQSLAITTDHVQLLLTTGIETEISGAGDENRNRVLGWGSCCYRVESRGNQGLQSQVVTVTFDVGD
jgi:hypothetical protein